MDSPTNDAPHTLRSTPNENKPFRNRALPPSQRSSTQKTRPSDQTRSVANSLLKTEQIEAGIGLHETDDVVILRSATVVPSHLFHIQDRTRLHAPFHELRWSWLHLVARSVGDFLASHCELSPDRFPVVEALELVRNEGQPIAAIAVPPEAAGYLQRQESASHLQRLLNVLADERLTTQTTQDFAVAANAERAHIEAVKRLRAALPGTRLPCALSLMFRGWACEVTIPTILCDPAKPTTNKRLANYYGRFSGFDIDDRIAHFRPGGKTSRIDMAFDEVQFFSYICEQSVRRLSVKVEVSEHLEDGKPVAFEIINIIVTQDGLV